jgi:gluconate 2-dehydrogenase gamma chain
MAGQGIERRRILRYIGIASVASTFPGFCQWTFACSHDEHHAAQAPSPASPYQPLFFTQDQFRLVDHLTEMIIPADDTPGAKVAGVAEFIDFMLANRVPVANHEDSRSVEETLRRGTAEQVAFVGGLEWLNARSQSEYQRAFLDITAAQQTALLEELAYKSKYTPNTERGREFFRLLRHYTVVGYYTSKIGLETLGYPGLRTAWPKFPGCSHPDDPEHAHLVEPRPQSAVASLAKNGKEPHPLSALSSIPENGTPTTENRSLTESPPALARSSVTAHGARNTERAADR